MKTYIYILEDPITQEVRYVGKSNNPKRRYQSHLCNKPKVKYHSYYWIQNLLKNGVKPILTIIDETEDNWESLEKYWIEQFKNWGYKLTNCTLGGEGVYGAGKWNNTPVSAYSKEGIFIKSFESQKECANYFKTSPANVKNSVSGRNILLLKKYQIRYGINQDRIEKAKNRKIRNNKGKSLIKNKRKIICIEDNIIFYSLTEASIYYNISITSISNILNERAKKSRNKKSFRYV